MPANNRGGLFWAILLIVLGTVFLLNNFNLVPGAVIDWWPVLVIGAGLWLLGQAATRRGGGGLVGGMVLLALGGYWLALNFGVVDDRLFLPVLLIALGVGLLLRAFSRDR
jgi:hypothetical protein